MIPQLRSSPAAARTLGVLRGFRPQNGDAIPQSDGRSGAFGAVVLAEGDTVAFAAKGRQGLQRLRAAGDTDCLVNGCDHAALAGFDRAENGIADRNPLPSVLVERRCITDHDIWPEAVHWQWDCEPPVQLLQRRFADYQDGRVVVKGDVSFHA